MGPWNTTIMDQDLCIFQAQGFFLNEASFLLVAVQGNIEACIVILWGIDANKW